MTQRPQSPRWGLSVELGGLSLREHKAALQTAETAGYTDVWSGETAGHDGFTILGLASQWTERLRLGTGVVNVFTRGRAVLAQHSAALQDASDGRFALGLGTSTSVIVKDWNGIEFTQPMDRVHQTVDFLRSSLAGGRSHGGFRLAQPPSTDIPIVLAGLRGRMLQTAAALGDGVFLNLVPLAAMPLLMESIRCGAEAAGRSPDELEVVCRIPCIPGKGNAAKELARQLFVSYATVPVYTEYFRWLGYGDALETTVTEWRAGRRRSAMEAIPDDILHQTFAFGSPDHQRSHIDKVVAAGVTCPVLFPVLQQPSVSEYCAWIKAVAPI